MRFVPTFAGCLLLFALVLPATTPSVAQTNYPWCSNFADGWGGTNCGFVSYEQCMATVRGSGGYCDKNDSYRPQIGGAASAAQSHKATWRNKTTWRN